MHSNNIYSDVIYGGGVGAGGGATIPRPPSIPEGGSLIFIDPITDKILLSASHFDCLIFEMTVKTIPYGGVTELDFKFSYVGNYPTIDGAKVRIRVGNQEVGYATLSSYAVKGYTLEGKGISIWKGIQNYKSKDAVFYRQNMLISQVIKDFALWVATEARLEGYWWPVDAVIMDEDIDDYLIESFDNDKSSVKATFDTLARLLDVYYEVRGGVMLFHTHKRNVLTSAYGIDIQPSLDTVVNTLEIHAIDRASDTLQLAQTLIDDESVRLYGTRLERLEISTYATIDYAQYGARMLTPRPLYTGSFSLVALGQVYFDDFYVPTYEPNLAITLCNTLEGWSGEVELVDHPTNNLAIRIEGTAQYAYRGALDSVRIYGYGNFNVRFLSYDRSSLSYSFNSQGNAHKDFSVGLNIYAIEIYGSGTLLNITGQTSQGRFQRVRPTQISYTVRAGVVEAKCTIGDGQSLVDFLSKLDNNQVLMRNFIGG